MYTNHIQTALQRSVTFHESAGFKTSPDHFILKHGRLFTSIAPKRRFLPWLKRAHSCYTNCLQLSRIERLVYVEGCAVVAGTGVEVGHAWCLDADGRVLDPTWEVPGDAYFGVPISHVYASERYDAQALAGGLVGSLLEVGDDDYALARGVETRPWKADVTAPGT